MSKLALSSKGSPIVWAMLLTDIVKEDEKREDEGDNSDK
jgi:hypothetical protein